MGPSGCARYRMQPVQPQVRARTARRPGVVSGRAEYPAYRQIADMHRTGTAKGHQEWSRRITAALANMHPHRCRHGLIYDIVDDPRRLGCTGAQWGADQVRNRAFRQRSVEAAWFRPRSARGPNSQAPDRHPTRWALCRPGHNTQVPDRHQRSGVPLRRCRARNSRDAASARTDLDHIDGRDGHWKSARFREPPCARDFEVIGHRQRTVAG